MVVVADSVLCFNQTIRIILIYDRNRYGGTPSFRTEEQL